MEKGLVSAKGWPHFIFMPADLLTMLQNPNGKATKKVNVDGGKR